MSVQRNLLPPELVKLSTSNRRTAAGQPLIDIQGVGKDFPYGSQILRVLRGIDLQVRPGEALSIMGPSGSGKSTLMNIIGCMDRPSRGRYRLADQDVDELAERDLCKVRNRTIGFVFQSFHLLPRLTAWRNVEIPMLYGGVSTEDRRERSKDLLERVGLGHRLHHRPNELSGGERQRVGIARALALEPALILADEPTGNLDQRTGKDILRLFSTLHREGKTIIVVTHDPDVARWADRIITIKDGRLV
ncbi:ABC transporter ATP-binding protein [Heliobacterium chlorum]|uniref:ABC transporter ATP-binding protein n=1 Tax=Heliobacterium chlorum TaxID=2698 RepID=A0ABR7SZ54_HELCL|nr:ABC transporter ATP-binding protein [Heliobacterium chlorum]MBC9782980.1 ABC transporter ATP-binding protein [Heliobacterium chlorum]